jgi:hypothetical protein
VEEPGVTLSAFEGQVVQGSWSGALSSEDFWQPQLLSVSTEDHRLLRSWQQQIGLAIKTANITAKNRLSIMDKPILLSGLCKPILEL